ITEKLGLQEVVQELQLKQQEIIYFQSNHRAFLEKFDLKIEQVISLNIKYDSLTSLIEEREKEIESINKAVGDDEVQDDKTTLNGKIKSTNEEIQEEQSKLDGSQKAYQDYLKEKVEFELRKKEILGSKEKPNTLNFFEHELNYI